jgi:hypothetical protein
VQLLVGRGRELAILVADAQLDEMRLEELDETAAGVLLDR